MASIAPGANATTTSAKRTLVASTITVTKTAEMATATANEPSPALMWLSSVFLLIRAKRVPMTAPMPTSATPRIQGGRPPSIRPVPCSTAEASIAPNIQLAGNCASRSSRAAAMAAATSTASPSGEAIGPTTSEGADGAMPASASSNGKAAVRMITRMVCTTAIAATSAPFSAASMVICDSAPGLPASSAEVGSQPCTRCK
jgi:hypothetical protein